MRVLRPTEFSSPRSRRRRWPVALLVVGAGVAVAVPVTGAVGDWIEGWADPTEPRVTDRSTTPLLLALEDLSEYHAATTTLQVEMQREIDTPWLPSVISGQRVDLLATGSVDAFVDFAALDADGVTVSADGESVAIVLPAAELSEVRIDHENTRVLDRDRGLIERVGGAFDENPVDDSALYVLAERELAEAAADSDVLERAEDNTRGMLTRLGRSFGVDEVTVTFEDPDADA